MGFRFNLEYSSLGWEDVVCRSWSLVWIDHSLKSEFKSYLLSP